MPSERESGRDPLRVLYVEDDEDYFVLVRELLGEVDPDIELHWAGGAASARDLAGRSRYDAFLLDLRLGAESGLDLLREWRSAGCAAPMVLVTGSDDLDVAAEALAAGADEVLVKAHPFADAVQRALRSRPAVRGE